MRPSWLIPSHASHPVRVSPSSFTALHLALFWNKSPLFPDSVFFLARNKHKKEPNVYFLTLEWTDDQTQLNIYLHSFPLKPAEANRSEMQVTALKSYKIGDLCSCCPLGQVHPHPTPAPAPAPANLPAQAPSSAAAIPTLKLIIFTQTTHPLVFYPSCTAAT